MRFLSSLALLLLAACGPSAEEGEQAAAPAPAAASQRASPAPTQTPDYSPPPLSPDAAKGEAGARNVLLSWARAVEERAFAQAYALYGKDGPADGTSEADFAADFARYRTITAEIGEGEVEGAAGSLYYAVPVELSGTLRDGSSYSRSGTITLRRVNDVPGALDWQLAWHIEKIEWDR